MFKVDLSLGNNLKIGNHLITHNGRNVYIDGVRVLCQYSKNGVYISKFVWNGNSKKWENFIPTEVLKNNKVNYFKVVMSFIDRLKLFNLDEYLQSTDCKNYKNL